MSLKKNSLLWLTAFIILLDQATKLRVRYFMNLGESVSVLGDFFRITYITNAGAAFGLSLGGDMINRLFFVSVSVLALLLFTYLFVKEEKKNVQIAYALILGGALGNLIDRIVHGAVIDFFDFKFFSFVMDRWPVFNIADSAIVVAMFLLLIDIFFPFRGETKSKSEKDFPLIEEFL